MRKFTLIAALLLPGLAQAGGLIAAHTLPAGTVISAGDVMSAPDAPEETPFAIGLQTRVTIYEGRAIVAAQLRPAVLVSRNQIVRLVYQRSQLMIEAEGRALAEGAAGDSIRVMNVASRSTIFARVNPDGTLSVTN